MRYYSNTSHPILADADAETGENRLGLVAQIGAELREEDKQERSGEGQIRG